MSAGWKTLLGICEATLSRIYKVVFVAFCTKPCMDRARGSINAQNLTVSSIPFVPVLRRCSSKADRDNAEGLEFR